MNQCVRDPCCSTMNHSCPIMKFIDFIVMCKYMYLRRRACDYCIAKTQVETFYQQFIVSFQGKVAKLTLSLGVFLARVLQRRQSEKSTTRVLTNRNRPFVAGDFVRFSIPRVQCKHEFKFCILLALSSFLSKHFGHNFIHREHT